MSYLDRYKRRMQANAGVPKEEISSDRTTSLREAQLNRATDSQRRSFYDSPTLTQIVYDGQEFDVIRSDKYKDIMLQTFLFAPNTPVEIGTLIETEDYTYLATDKNGETIFPELLAKLCNDSFEVPMGFEQRIEHDRFGNPIYIDVPITIPVPVVISDKDYSVSSNSIIPLPSGRINIEMPYEPEYVEHFKVNFRFPHSGGDYTVTDVRVVKLTPTEKYIKVSATRVVSEA